MIRHLRVDICLYEFYNKFYADGRLKMTIVKKKTTSILSNKYIKQCRRSLNVNTIRAKSVYVFDAIAIIADYSTPEFRTL